MKALLRELAPPVLLRLFRAVRGGRLRFDGPFPDWDTSARRARGYDDTAIVAAVRRSALKVQRGEAAYEQDSVAFAEPSPPYPLLAALLRVACSSGGRLHVMDFGGSLGSTYYRCRSFLEGAVTLRWSVIEQPAFVECGRREFQNVELAFFDSLESCLAAGTPDVALFSSSLPYVRDPYVVLDQVERARVPYLLFDRNQQHDGDADLVYLQTVPPAIYDASYPCRVFSAQALATRLSAHHDRVAEWDCEEGPFQGGGVEIRYRGALWRRRSP